MANVREARDLVGAVPGEAPNAADTEADAGLGPKIDLWLSYYRFALASAGLALVLLLLRKQAWVIAMVVAYLIASTLVPLALRLAATLPRKAVLRICVLLMDVTVVSMLAFAWGTRSSPAVFMYLPIVVGWTLVPQPGLSKLSLFLSLAATVALFVHEEMGLPGAGPGAESSPNTAAAGPLLFFGFLASALIAVRKLIDFTVARLRQHSLLVGQLIAEKEAREREAQWAARFEESHRLEALGRLAGGIAHDFNNLLTALLGFAELAEAQLKSDPESAASALRELQKAVDRAGTLTTQLLEFASRKPSQPRDIELSAAVTHATTLLQRLLKDTVELRVQLSSEACYVRLDPSSLDRLLVNLVLNAADAMPGGGVLTITTKQAGEGAEARAVLEVQDTGMGIPAADVRHLFEPFFTRKERGKGTGLGLASVYGIVKQSEGDIDVETALGQGTVFRVRWPLLSHAPEQPVIERTKPTRGDETILLVDDDPAVRAVLVGHLEAGGYSVLSASSGEAALALLADNRERVALLVSDVSMPGMSGFELARIARERAPELPVLLISGYAEELLHDQAGASLGVGFLAKPFSRARLLTEVRAILDVNHSGVRTTVTAASRPRVAPLARPE